MTSSRSRATVALLAVVLLVAGYRLSPLWPGPGLPAGAAPLHIETTPPHLIPTFSCPVALLVDVRITTAGNDLVVVSTSDGSPIRVVWPSGWAAWRRDGRAELVNRDGAVIGREGDVIGGFGGGDFGDHAFHVCAP